MCGITANVLIREEKKPVNVRTGRFYVVLVLCLPLGVVGLPPAGHRVADTCAGSRVHVLHHDEGMLLQRGDGQVTVIGHLLQEVAVTRPDRVADLNDPPGVRSHLRRGDRRIQRL